MTGHAASAAKTALITGASRGLGRVLAEFLAFQGYRLVITARGRKDLETVQRELSRHTEVAALVGDVCDPGHRRALADAARDGLDLLINNASTLGPVPLPHLTQASPADLMEAYATNAVAPVALVAATLPALQARQGLVVNVTSDAAVGGYPTWGAYGAAKAALELMSKTLAAELEGVSVVTVDPGDMRTEMHQAAFPGEDISDRPWPDETLPFWAWLLGSDPASLNGRRLAVQDDLWRDAPEPPDAPKPPEVGVL